MSYFPFPLDGLYHIRSAFHFQAGSITSSSRLLPAPAGRIHPAPCLPGRRRFRPAGVHGDSPPPTVSSSPSPSSSRPPPPNPLAAPSPCVSLPPPELVVSFPTDASSGPSCTRLIALSWRRTTRSGRRRRPATPTSRSTCCSFPLSV